MNFSNAFRFSFVAHIGIVGVVVVLSFFQGCFTTSAKDVPMFDLIQGDGIIFEEADVGETTPEPPTPEPPPPPPPPEPPKPLKDPDPIVDPEADALIEQSKKDPPKPEPPKPDPPKPPPPKPEPPKPPTPRPPIDTSKARPVTRPVAENSFEKTHTRIDPDAISGALNVGTPTPGNPKLSATETQRINNAIREALKREWEKETVGALEGSQRPVLEITFANDGRVTAANVITSSGSKIFDDAAKRSALRVRVSTGTAWTNYLRENKNKAIIIFDF